MLTRVREHKGSGPSRNTGAPARGPAAGGRHNAGGRKPRGFGADIRTDATGVDDFDNADGGHSAQPRSHLSAAEQAVRGPGQRPARGYGGGNGGGYGGPVGLSGGSSRTGGTGQPDPMRTSVDMMADRGPRRNNFGGGNRKPSAGGGFGGGAGFGGGPGRTGGGNRSGSRGRSGNSGGTR